MSAAMHTPRQAPGAPPMVVVFGSTSYLGQYVLRNLLARGYRVIAVTRNPAISAILLREFEGRIVVCRSEELQPVAGGIAALVNLAYVKTEKPYRLMRQNARLIQSVHAAALRLGAQRLLHASTMAVFGYALTEEPRALAAPRRFGDPYFESKIAAEHLLQRLQRESDYTLALVRLGNIIGPGSPVWTANLAQRLLEARPVGVRERDGYSNAALAENIASYFGHLVACDAGALTAFGPYHHVAEFSDVRWSTFVDAFAQRMGVEPVRVGAVPAVAGGSASPSLATRLKTIYAGRIGGYARALLGAVDVEAAFEQLMFTAKTALVGRSVQSASRAVPGDREFLTILSSEFPFRSHVLPDWTPPITLEDASASMVAWLSAAGFAPPLVGPAAVAAARTAR